ncbi:MAG: palindromic element RPE4 domain-containing protein [Rickettsia endosymbiont of Eriopis connexa]|nr:palindromic element RPE4 domain-containing protein [Rickettsia endosymbiont of Eriopis connexa]
MLLRVSLFLFVILRLDRRIQLKILILLVFLFFLDTVVKPRYDILTTFY